MKSKKVKEKKKKERKKTEKLKKLPKFWKKDSLKIIQINKEKGDDINKLLLVNQLEYKTNNQYGMFRFQLHLPKFFEMH